jgi:hypothetical protein
MFISVWTEFRSILSLFDEHPVGLSVFFPECSSPVGPNGLKPGLFTYSQKNKLLSLPQPIEINFIWIYMCVRDINISI